MAIKRKRPVKSNGKKKKARVSFLKNKKFKFIIGVLVLLISVYLLIAFISFLFYGTADQSKLDLAFKSGIKNKTAILGAYLSELIINRGFGIPSFLFIYLMAITGFKILGSTAVKYRKNFLYSLIVIIWFSVAFGLIFTNPLSGSSIYMGGQYGFVMSSWLSSTVGIVGLVFLLLISALTIIIVRFEKSYSFIIRLFKKREGENKTTEQDEEEKELIVDDSFGKVIDDDDVVRAIFEPDLEEDKHGVGDLQIEIEETKKETEEKEGDLELVVQPKVKEEKTEEIDTEELQDYDPTLDLSDYKYPTLDLLEDHKFGNAEVSNEELISNKNKIVETLRHYKIEIIKIRATIGPTITLYEIIPAPGIRIAKIKNLEDDIALSLAALGIRIIAPIPGRGTIGIEVPNQHPEVVSMRSILSSKKYQESKAELPIALGKTISNETYMVDLAKMPHILVAGATGQGKSVGVNVIITSLLYKKHPSQLKFVFIDPKKVELNLYSIIEKHYLAKLPDEEEPVITDIQKVKNTLNSLGVEMDNRYDLLKKAHARNLKEYNQKFISRKLNPEKGHKFMPYIVVVIDEFADLIMTAGKEIELPIARIAQLARAVGIHMVIATQRPSVTIITGVIKANFPARIAFKVASMIDSRTILDQPGANQLIGKGDMLISANSDVARVQCAFVDTPEVERLCEFISGQRGYPTAFLLPEYVGDEEAGPGEVDLKNRDEMFDDAARIVVMNQMGSTSMIQRKFSIGYNRAGRIMDQLEAAGIVGPSEGSKARRVHIPDEYSLEQLLNGL